MLFTNMPQFTSTKFTIPELQKLYGTILNKSLDCRIFQCTIMSYGIIKILKDVKAGVAHKARYLYSFVQKNYIETFKNSLGGGW